MPVKTKKTTNISNTADLWYQSLVDKLQDFNAFKLEFLRYFSNNNSINRLANTFTTIKQRETEAVTTYLGRFHRNLQQIQAIDANYFTVPQIFNQFIYGLCSSILQHDTVTHARDFEFAELEANHAHTMNLVINGSSELDFKLKQFKNMNYFQNQLRPSSSLAAPNQPWQPEMHISNSKSLPKSRSNYLPANNAATNLSTASISISIYQLQPPVIYQPQLQIIYQPQSIQTLPQNSNLGAGATQNPNSQNYLSLLVIPEDATNTNSGSNQQLTLTSNIPPATVTENELFAAIFSFEIKEPSGVPLFSRATIEEKLIMAMYTNAKIDGHSIKVILNSGSADSIITRQLMDQLANRATKTLIGKIDNLSIEINGITVPIKVLVIEATQYQALIGNNWLSKTNAILNWNIQELQLSQNGQYTRVPATCGHFKPNNITSSMPLINFEEEKPKLIWEVYQVLWADVKHNELLPILDWEEKNNIKRKGTETEEHTWETTIDAWNNDDESKTMPTSWKKKRKEKEKEEDLSGKADEATEKITNGWEREYLCEPTIGHKSTTTANPAIENTMVTQNNKASGTTNHVLLAVNSYSTKEYGTTFLVEEEHATLCANTQFSSVIGPKEFHKHYQNLAPTRKEQEQRLEEINTQLCDHCLIPCDFQYCNEYNLIYNLPPRMIYTISEKEEPISNCASESESPFNYDSNSNNDNNNNSSSFIQNSNNNNNDSNSDPNSNTNYKQYIALPNLSKKQELKWYSNNEEGIMPERMHDTDAGFDLRYPGKEAIKLKPHSCTCINLKIVLEILATTMVQLASRSSLAKRGINIKGGIIDAGYVRNIITMLQNDSEKTYIIEPNEKIAQAIFLSLVRIAQLVSVEKREELEITVREIQGFRSMGRIGVSVNMAEKKIVNQGEIISVGQTISIPPYGQYMIGIKREVKEQNQIFEAEPTLCKSGEIGLINLHIPVKSHNHIKIPIYNNTRNIVEIPAKTTIGYLSIEIEDQLPSTIPDFLQLCGYVDITSQMIYRRSECYLLQSE
ncbi:hypothetical protein G9A89_005478 [Geosiphon pyriformis]|nr:hypothetical protein G9A89_005478 [Geosiphon pyriformis]